eukprot:TRINITY_DN67928_c0_g1_i1.p1 TRINITY_DN67928_c0_g1~~TRINITY_DN67928_c0_g1_i1.p1  ORF type:complete len:384 (+),score=37.00 TRINITY_DN67928_c0_g1_i1:102-1253(+)
MSVTGPFRFTAFRHRPQVSPKASTAQSNRKLVPEEPTENGGNGGTICGQVPHALPRRDLDRSQPVSVADIDHVITECQPRRISLLSLGLCSSNAHTTSSGRPKYIIQSSRVASLVSQNPYDPAGNALAQMWMARDPVGFVEALSRFDIQFVSMLEELHVKDPEGKMKLLVDKISLRTWPPNELQTHLAKVRLLGQKLGISAATLRELASQVRTRQGIMGESVDLDAVEAATQSKISARNDHLRWLQVPSSRFASRVAIHICGRVDGIDEFGNVVEAKRRASHFFFAARPYEIIQLHMYMHMVGSRRARLIETWQGQQIEHRVVFDPRVFSALMVAIIDSVRLIERCVKGSTRAQRQVLIGSGFATLRPRGVGDVFHVAMDGAT